MRFLKLVPGALLLWMLPSLLLFCVCAVAQTAPAPSDARSGDAKSGASAGHAENGKIVFARAGCNACHGDQGQGGTIGPQLAPPGLDQAAMMQYVRKPAGSMPAVSVTAVSDQELVDVYAFLQSLAPGKPVESLAGDTQKGKQLYTTYGCYECHGTQGQGASVVLGGLFVTGARIGPSPISQSAFIQYVRHPGGQMPLYSEKVASSQDLADIFAFLKTIPLPPAASSIPLLNQ